MHHAANIEWSITGWDPDDPFNAALEFSDEHGPVVSMALTPKTVAPLLASLDAVRQSQQQAVTVGYGQSIPNDTSTGQALDATDTQDTTTAPAEPDPDDLDRDEPSTPVKGRKLRTVQYILAAALVAVVLYGMALTTWG